MQLTILKSKIHRAVITETDLNYEGSIGIDADLLKAASILPFEQVDVLNINNGERFTTYAIEKKAGSRAITINGAAARKAQKGDMVIIVCYAAMEEGEARKYKPKVILVNSENCIV